jgi:hypothetical protein
MTQETSRRELFKLATVAGASAIGAGLIGNALGTPVRAQETLWPWPLTKKISVKKAAQTAYEYYYQGGCMYGTLIGIAKDVADKLGEPYSQYPWDMARYGSGGVELWGSTCGTLNAGAMALALFVSDTALRRKMCNQLFNWYESTKLPSWNPKKPLKPVPNKLPTSLAKSPLCHTSVSRWCKASGYDAFSPERADRCARMCGSVATLVTTMLNEAVVKGKLKSRKEMSTTATTCLGCHGAGDSGLNEPNILSRMDCELCHDAETNHLIFPHP